MLALCLMGAAFAASTTDDLFDPARYVTDRATRMAGADVLYGARTSSSVSLVRRWSLVEPLAGALHSFLAPELSGDLLVVRPTARLVAGTASPQLNQGDKEPGILGVRAGLDARGQWQSLEWMIRPEFRLDERTPGLGLPLGWLGLHTPNWRVGFGVEERWLGPGRHGGLMLTDNARPAPLGSGAFEGRLGEKWGRIRAELGAGWLDANRTDVQRPGWLLMDFRWAPVPALELGLSRVSLFGGVNRPSPKLGQLILPTNPHIYDDPEQSLPDQDEMAAFDVRLTVPVGKWLDVRTNSSALSLRYLEVWMQYGGEDVIARSIGPVPVPALAGIANLWGAEVGLGNIVANVEWARVLDDQFRWYTGHRVYHEGFVQDGLVMGHPSGGDSRTWDASIRWMSGVWGVQLLAEDCLRVGGIDAAQGMLRTLGLDEHTQGLGIRGWMRSGMERWWHAGMSLEQRQNPNFQPVPSEWLWRVHFGV